jgi:hypothetical protein
MRLQHFTIVALLFTHSLRAQERPFLPKDIDPSRKYVFYLHGGIVQEQGANAISEQFGPYEYYPILKELESQGFIVISEVRAKGTDEVTYARGMKLQIDSLIIHGVPEHNIVAVGASLGAYICVELAMLLEKPEIRYALLGLCSDYALNHFREYRPKLCGNFLSVYEKSDSKGSCISLFTENGCAITKEIALNTGNSHGFLYKPYPEWTKPLFDWIRLP